MLFHSNNQAYAATLIDSPIAVPARATAQRKPRAPYRLTRLCRPVAAVLGVLMLGVTAEAGQSHLQAANLRVFGDPTTELDGAVTLQRSRRGVQARISAGGLDPNSAYTVWWVVFNNPQACATAPCAGADLRDPEVGGANFYATGFITGDDGTANVAARLDAGRLAEGVEFIDFGTGARPWLKPGNGLRAEIHVVLRGHGPLMPGEVAEQISTGEFGDCELCANQQAAIFLPAR